MSKILVKYTDDAEEFYGFTIIDANEEETLLSALEDSKDYNVLDFLFYHISDAEGALLEKMFPGGFGIDFYGDLFPDSKIDDVSFLLLDVN